MREVAWPQLNRIEVSSWIKMIGSSEWKMAGTLETAPGAIPGQFLIDQRKTSLASDMLPILWRSNNKEANYFNNEL
jgi:hypothetical protein